MSQLSRAQTWIVPCLVALGTTSAEAAAVKGSVTPPPKPVADAQMLGYTVTRVASPAETLEGAKKDVALFLRSKESLPIPPPKEHLEIAIRGMRLVPNVATCAVDAQVIFKNEEQEPVTVEVGKTKVGPIAPGETSVYECTAGEPEDPRPVRIPNWRHVSGLVYVAQSGVAGRPNERGYFSLNAPQGTYELQFVTAEGVAMRKEIEIVRSDVDVGTADLGTSEAPEEPAEPEEP